MTKSPPPGGPAVADATRLAHLGRDPARQHGFVNTPVYRGSTVLFATLAALDAYDQPYTYGRRGTPTTHALEACFTALEGGAATVLTPSGLSAVTTTLLAYAEAGAHILVPDSVYQPARRFCDTVLRRLGTTVEYYDPLIGAGIAAHITPRTTLIWLESPGSLTFEVQDTPAIAGAARAAGVATALDNTWATGLYHRPLALGVNIAVQAATKYPVGHADALLGAITADAQAAPRIAATHGELGLCAAPDDCMLTLRGLRTLAVRLERHQASALRVAGWLAGQRGILAVRHPALPGDPGHALWRRDFTGATGLFAVDIARPRPGRLAAMLDGLRLFGMGYSWGGYESLIVPSDPATCRSATRWPGDRIVLRLHIGLEDADDLIADLAAGLARLGGAQ